jgi:hypothetical protein
MIRSAPDAMKRAFAAAGRDDSNIPLGHIMMPSDAGADGVGDIRASMAAQLPQCRAAGITHIRLFPSMYCKGPNDFEAFLDDALAAL